MVAIFGRECWNDLKVEDPAIGRWSAVHYICRDLLNLIDVTNGNIKPREAEIASNYVPNTE